MKKFFATAICLGLALSSLMAANDMNSSMACPMAKNMDKNMSMKMDKNCSMKMDKNCSMKMDKNMSMQKMGENCPMNKK